MKTIRFALTAVLTMGLVACGGGGGGTTAYVPSIWGLTVDSLTPSKLLVANAANQTIQWLPLSGASVSVLAGSANTAGTTDNTGAAARFNAPYGIALSGSDYYVADTGNHTIRKVTSTGVVTTVAGTAGTAGTTDDVGTLALFTWPKGLHSLGNYLYITENYYNTIRKMDLTSHNVTTLVGDPTRYGTTDGNGSSALFNSPFGITSDGSTNLYVTDSDNHTVRQVTTAGVSSTLAGTSGLVNGGFKDDVGTAAQFKFPAGIVYYADPTDGGVLFVADSGNNVIRRIVISTKNVTTFAGSSTVADQIDATSGSNARFNYPVGITLDPVQNVLYVSDQNRTKVRKIVIGTGAVSGAVTTLSASF